MMKLLSQTLLTVLVVDLLTTSGDITMTWTSPVLPKLHSNDSEVNPFDQPITEAEDSWIGSLINVGAMMGPFPYGYLAKKFGRRISLLCIAIPHIISYLIFAFSTTVYLYYFARLFGGIAVGAGYTLLPMYVAEVSEDSNRGRMSSTLNTFWCLGNLIPYVIGPYLPIMWFNMILACVPATFFVLFFLIAPESPYYLMIMNKTDEAKDSLMKLRFHNKEIVEAEMKHIEIEINKNEEKISLVDFFKTKVYMKGLIISLVLILAQQFSGLSVLLLYTQQIFEDAGVKGIKPEESSIIIGGVIFFISFFVPLIIGRLGRKILLLISLMGCSVGNLLLGTFFYLKYSAGTDVSSISWVPVVSMVGFMVMTTIGIGPLPWTVSSELFPTNVKTYAATIVAFVCWTTSFFITKFFNDLKNNLGLGETFWLFGGCCLLSWVFTLIFVPETKGKSFQQIQEILEKR